APAGPPPQIRDKKRPASRRGFASCHALTPFENVIFTRQRRRRPRRKKRTLCGRNHSANARTALACRKDGKVVEVPHDNEFPRTPQSLGAGALGLEDGRAACARGRMPRAREPLLAGRKQTALRRADASVARTRRAAAAVRPASWRRSR